MAWLIAIRTIAIPLNAPYCRCMRLIQAMRAALRQREGTRLQPDDRAVGRHALSAIREFTEPAVSAVVGQPGAGAVGHPVVGGQAGLGALQRLRQELLELLRGARGTPDADLVEL